MSSATKKKVVSERVTKKAIVKNPKGLRITIPNNNNNNNNRVSRKNVDNGLKKQCYNKGISLCKINSNRVVNKNVSVLKKQCSGRKNKSLNANANTIRYGVPPKPERALAIMKRNNSKPIMRNAIKFANDPFYDFGFPVYLPVSPIPGKKNTRPKNHVVYTILPNYFPGRTKR